MWPILLASVTLSVVAFFVTRKRAPYEPAQEPDEDEDEDEDEHEDEHEDWDDAAILPTEPDEPSVIDVDAKRRERRRARVPVLK